MSPYTGSHLAPLAMGIPSPVVASMGPLEYNLERLYKATPDVTMPRPLNQNGFPDSTFWTEKSWEAWVEKEREIGTFNSNKQGEGINSSWMVDADGDRVDVDQQQKILGEARRTWNTMSAFQIPLTTYRLAPVPTLDYFRARMESKFWELQLCTDHWKVDRVWKENFSSWNKPAEPKGQPKKVSRLQSYGSAF